MTPFAGVVYRGVFTAAALYNLAFGVWTIVWPLAFFDWFELAPPRYPAIWSCLGMVVGVYGVLYAYVARHLDRGKALIAVGLAGKVLGPAGWVLTVSSGEWPARTLSLIVLNDFIWWLPFSCFILEGTAAGTRLRRWAPRVCAATNAAAVIAMALALRRGTEIVADPVARMQFIAENPVLWRGAWALWCLAAVTLIGFYAWWAGRIPRRGAAIAAVSIAAIGMVCDLVAESLYIGWLPDYPDTQPVATLMTGAVANGLYTLAGIVLTLNSPALTHGLSIWAWAIWTAGVALTIATIVGSAFGIAVATAVLFGLFCPWVVAVAWRWR